MFYKYFKRLLDIIFSLLGLVITAPILLIIAIAIKLETPGPILFKQERLGMNGKVFKIFKFRSMCEGAEKTGSGQYSFIGDTRVTKVGKLIRKTSIDELPQFLNIITGDMSLIGPRPTLTYHPWPLENYSEKQKRRFLVRPGVTGLAQINGRKEIQWEKRFEYDIEYVEKLSFFLDLKIFFITIKKVVFMEDNVNTTVTNNETSVNN